MKRIEITISVSDALDLLGLLHYIEQTQHWKPGLVEDIDQQITRQMQEAE